MIALLLSPVGMVCFLILLALASAAVLWLRGVPIRPQAVPASAPTKQPTTPTRQRRQVRVVQRATMLRRLREQARAHDEAMARLTRQHDARWAMLLVLMMVANQPRPVDERRAVVAAPRVVEAL